MIRNSLVVKLLLLALIIEVNRTRLVGDIVNSYTDNDNDSDNVDDDVNDSAGNEMELCPDLCDCYHLRISWITDCSNDNLTEIPYEELSENSIFLNLELNRIRKVRNRFPIGSKLRKLNLHSNRLVSIDAQSFDNLNFLVEIDLSDNRIETIDPNLVNSIAGLLSLKLSSNPLTELNESFLISNSLMYLNVRNCSLKRIDGNAFRNLTTLSTLDLSENRGRHGEFDERLFKPLKNLAHLDLSECNLTTISTNLLNSLNNLEELKLNGNNLFKVKNDWVEILNPLGKLTVLELNSANLSVLPLAMFNGTVYLRTLKLADNNFTGVQFSKIFKANRNQLKSLEILDLSNCHLKSKFTKDSLKSLSDLRQLDLSGNNQIDNLSDVLKHLINLEQLIVRNAGLKRLPNIFQDLIKLDVSRNQLDTNFTASLVDFSKLEYLNIADCNLTLTTQSLRPLQKMSSIKHLIMSGNHFQSLDYRSFRNFTNLVSLQLNNCHFHGFVDNDTDTSLLMSPSSSSSSSLSSSSSSSSQPFQHLKELYLANNSMVANFFASSRFESIPKEFAKLEIIDLSYSNLTYLSKNTFNFTRNITKLCLRGNRLNSHSKTTFDFLLRLPNLQELDLSKNLLNEFDLTVIDNQSKITTLQLFDNPWFCDRFICDLFRWTRHQDHHLYGFQMHSKSLSCWNKKDQTRKLWAKYVRDQNCSSSSSSSTHTN